MSGSLRSSLREKLRHIDFDSLNRGTVCAIDPGPRASYYAVFQGGELIETGKMQHGPGGNEYACLASDVVLIETPVGWPVKAKDGGMALLNVAVMVGRLEEGAIRSGAETIMVGSTEWRAALFGRPNPSDRDVRLYVGAAVDLANRKVRLNNVHVRDAIGMYLAVLSVAREGSLL